MANIVECKCPVCKKIFVPAPMHVYKSSHTNGERYVCSWHCVLESERIKEEKAKYKKPKYKKDKYQKGVTEK